ncbi:MAG: molybdopterin-dependent oxidoreductase [Ardenticatenales bacterium]|nr:molybdopterin-dependent oxidoreductase [Ardenticatenales bacterium]
MNRKVGWLVGLLIGALSAVALVALFFMGNALASLPLVPFDIFDWIARVLPGNLITLGIDGIVRLIDTLNLGDTSRSAKLIEQLMAGGMIVAFGAAAGGVVSAVGRSAPQRAPLVGALLGLVGFLFSWVAAATIGFGANRLLSLLWLAVLWLGWGYLLGTALQQVAQPRDAAQGHDRRTVLKWAAGSVAAALLFGVVARRGNPSARSVADTTGDSATSAGDAVGAVTSGNGAATLWREATPPEALMARPEAVTGVRPELTPTDDFYRIDINTRPQEIDVESWQLEVSGLFDAGRPLTLAALKAYPAVTQPLTMSCISNRVGGDLIGTTLWTGLHLRDLLTDLGLQEEAQVLRIEGSDGFYEYVVRDDLMDERTLLVYEMNGAPLPVEHGAPLRIYIPNRYGMKQPKWITRIEALPEWEPGYWVTRGWSREARPQIVSVIDTVNVGDMVDGVVPVGGIAWAGDRGIQKVEVQVGNGPWEAATLRKPPLSPLTWVQWRYDWKTESGRYAIRVRATDGTGTVQAKEIQGVRPDGATGYHERQVRV